MKNPRRRKYKIYTYAKERDVYCLDLVKNLRGIFQQLISIWNWSSTARTILSSISPKEIKDAVWSEDVKGQNLLKVD